MLTRFEYERISQRGSGEYSVQYSLSVTALYSGPVLLELKFPSTSMSPPSPMLTNWSGIVIPLRTAMILSPASVSPLSSVYLLPASVSCREGMKGALRASSDDQNAARLSLISVKAPSSPFPESPRMVLPKLLKLTPPWSAMRLK